MQIGILSDTHGFLPEDVYNFSKIVMKYGMQVILAILK